MLKRRTLLIEVYLFKYFILMSNTTMSQFICILFIYINKSGDFIGLLYFVNGCDVIVMTSRRVMVVGGSYKIVYSCFFYMVIYGTVI